ncbi:precorrin-8X methylmutase [Desulfuromonas versatilis]|uniref:Precorrin-8X methylmutase n=1 Tax=Desulfuromonas versatilis TaxID=2802975 RepID=A0ABM9SDF2_9BACT|nr:precorrin-8X methylmutase [Desulfuromonas versatilis]BCR03738.1 precorrin-8X methylmutase [Desulfuromonas versatilis]
MTGTGAILNPQEIEAKSFEIIDAEVGPHGYDRRQWPVVRRIIHTTADFDFARITRFSAGAIEAGVAALRRGEKILCDTNMVKAGVNKTGLAGFGCQLDCHVADPEVARAARAEGITRSIVATRKGVAEGCGIYLIGNAPTALFELLRLAEEGSVSPSLVVGVPVGFVGAAESKEALLASGLPHISCQGRKGGSAIAATILNALMILAREA